MFAQYENKLCHAGQLEKIMLSERIKLIFIIKKIIIKILKIN